MQKIPTIKAPYPTSSVFIKFKMPIAKVEERVTAQEQAPNVDLKAAAKLTLVGKGSSYEFKSLTPCDLSKCTKREIKEYFENSYGLDELLFSAVKDEEFLFKCPDRLRLPLIFYLAHTSSVYVNKLMLAGLIDKRVNSHFEKLFETGVDEMSWDDTENYRMGGLFKWPSVHDVLVYRNEVRQLVLDVIDKTPLQLPVTQDSPWWSVFMGMEHERIHIETSSVLIRQLPVEAVKKPENWTYAPATIATPPGPNEFVKVPAGQVVIGKPREFPSYGWDNEYGKQEMDVPDFEATKYLVTNGEFLAFVNDCGYSRRELWTEEGWKWREFRQASHPSFWVCQDGCKSGCGAELCTYSHCNGVECNGSSNGTMTTNGATNGQGVETKFKYRAMFDVIEMPLHWPVDVNYHEAKAFCLWKGPEYRLPTEAEHHRMRGEDPPTCDVTCDPIYDNTFPANNNLKYGSSTPVNMYPPSSMGLYDVYGNVWEWTEDHFNGLPGFKTSFLYDDFSSPCFDGRHNVMMGGSWVSTGDEASRFARYAFRRHFLQHLGFRLAQSTSSLPVKLCNAEVFVLGPGVSDNPITAPGVELGKAMIDSTNIHFQCETQEKLEAQLLLEYERDESSNASFVEFVDTVVKEQGCDRDSIIHFGCGTGVKSFLLTKVFEKVTGVDFSGRFLDAAIAIQRGCPVEFETMKEAVVPDIAGIDVDRVLFKQLTWVPNEIEGYNMVLFEFIDRLSEPKGWLLKLWECVTTGGILIFLTAADSEWSETKLGVIIGKRFDLKKKTNIGNKMATIWQLKP